MKTLGSTNLSVSPLGVGLAALGRPGYINLGHANDLQQNYDVSVMEERAYRVMDEAWQAGIRYFDAARSYGRAEQFLGNWLISRNISPEAITIGSKWGYTYTANWQVDAEDHEIKDHSLPVLQRQWKETQANLGQYLSLYQIHSATLDSGVLENRPVLDELARLKENGLFVGLSLSGPAQAKTLQKALTIERDGQLLFDSVQATWNLLERSAEPALEEAHAAGMGVVIKEALANGRLSPRNSDPDFAGKMERLRQQAERLQTTIDALALAGVLAQPWVDIVLSGVVRVEHLHSNLQALQVSWDEEAARQLAPLVEPAERYWKTRKNLDWN